MVETITEAVAEPEPAVISSIKSTSLRKGDKRQNGNDEQLFE